MQTNVSTSKCKNSLNRNVEYSDSIKIKGDKIGMPCTHSAVIYVRLIIHIPRESTTQALYCRNDNLSILVDRLIYT